MGGLFRRYRRLSRLIIDANKNWGGSYGINNIKELAEAMAQGSILFRGASGIEKLAAGVPGQVLLTKGADANPVWGDVAGFAERLFWLTIPEPSISLAVAAASAPPGRTATPSLTIPAPPSISVTVEESWLLVEDCEDAWDEYVGANVTSTADTTDKKVGTASAKMDVAVEAAVGRLATEAISSKDLSPYKYLKAWVKSSIALDTGDLDILLDDDPQCVSPLKELIIPALAAGTWTQITFDMGDTSGLTAIISIGIDMNLDKGAFIFHIDQVRATKGG